MWKRTVSWRLTSWRRAVSASVVSSVAEGVKDSCAVSPLATGKAAVRYRSLPPDDPFGERSSWEDPSDGVYAAWKDVDQEGFVTAAESDDIRKAHFGPEWSRFTTVGRLSVKKMQEDPRHQTRTEGQPSVYPSAEEMHDKDLQQRKKMMSHNYSTYEEFLAGEMGGGNAYGEVDASDPDASLADGNQQGGPSDVDTLYVQAEMEQAFSEVEGLDGKDRMALRNPAREALSEAEAAAEGEEDVELPVFMQRDSDGDGQDAPASPAAPVAPIADKSDAATEATVGATPATVNETGRRPVPTEITRPNASSEDMTDQSKGGLPSEAFAAQVLAALPGHHGDTEIPLLDPVHWGTAQILHFLKCFEHDPAGGGESSLDESMVDAFHLAEVNGELLLNVVTPPRLFRVLRRWHVRRQEAVTDAWRQCHGSTGALGGAAQQEAAIQAAVAKAVPKLDEAVAPVTPLLIQETILLCFPYAR